MAARKKPAGVRSQLPTVRVAALSDAPAIVALGHPTNARDMKERLAASSSDSNYNTLVAELDGEVAGMAGACQARFYEKDGRVRAPGRAADLGEELGPRRGSCAGAPGRRLGPRAGASDIFVNTGVQRESARRFCERRDCRVTGVRFSKELE